jgi:DNA-binding LacI/PurR family transcriptional regulator
MILLVTIKDVAKAANVAPSTVSRVMSDNPHISKKTKIKVKAAMEQLEYQPNNAARTLVTKQSNTIGIIQKSGHNEIKQNPFMIDVLIGIYNKCKACNYATISTTSEAYEDLQNEVDRMINYHSLDGFILLYSKQNDEIENILIEQEIPYVVIGKALGNNKAIHIDNDNVKASRELTQSLIESRHSNILFVAEKGDYEVVNDRIEGFKDIVQQNDIISNIIHFEMQRDDILAYFKKLCSDNQLPTAIITSDTMLNHMVLSVLYELKIKIPDDLHTATFNDSYLNEFASPPQTAVNINPKLLGEVAGASVIDLIQGHPIEQYNRFIKTNIVHRISTKNRMKEICDE